MTVRALTAGLILITLAVAGCADDAGSVRSAPSPNTSATAPPPGSAHPTPRPTPSTALKKPPVKTRPTGLPAGLRRTTGVRGVALTFDDGPHPVWTPKVLDRLRAAHVTATFCLIGSKARRYPQLVARIVREGHQLCNHSWQHDIELGTKPVADIRADLLRTNRAIQLAVPGVKIPYYRQPGGKWTPALVTVARELGMQSLHWAVDPQDWAKPSAAVITKRVIDHARTGSIVLLHDGGGDRSATVAACPGIIATLQRRYGIVRLN